MTDNWDDISTAPKEPQTKDDLGMMDEPHGLQLILDNGEMIGEGYWIGDVDNGDWYFANNDSCNCCWGPMSPKPIRWYPFPKPIR